jgi:hypothetical protein
VFRRTQQSWALSKACLAVLARDKALMLFPVLAMFLTCLVVGSFFVPSALILSNLGADRSSQATLHVLSIPILFLFYFCIYTVVLFCNTALLSCAKMLFEGNTPTFSDGLRAGMSNLKAILIYAAIGGTIGVILRQLEEKLGVVGWLMRRFFGGAWSVITYFALPVMIFEHRSPKESIYRSKEILKATWGEAVGAYLGFTALNYLVAFVIIGEIVLSCAASVAANAPSAMFLGLGVAMILAVAASIVTSCLSQIFQAALYIYATTSELPSCFDSSMVQEAFMPRQGRKWALVKG